MKLRLARLKVPVYSEQSREWPEIGTNFIVDLEQSKPDQALPNNSR
jgi:hypothetical protein